ncbi:hypothetical protein RWE39_004377 [Salmonella enterica]|nr:hypothetical protein [Salmonella enterica]
MSKIAEWLALWILRIVILGIVAILSAIGLIICFPALISGDQDDGKTGYQ